MLHCKNLQLKGFLIRDIGERIFSYLKIDTEIVHKWSAAIEYSSNVSYEANISLSAFFTVYKPWSPFKAYDWKYLYYPFFIF